ncbi:hypothetical protein EES39_04695 [Streptomyces sp. ADI92-24]|uniref:hypothetical protein n=1 Tax=Streptomyces sp. ADI92-24 TaxID=1522756 RepID=UPI000F558B1D|nr:hypothetical protein [Streptomyces sp. ADI92-24]RPK51179.1 hypothetical protein EES39_04695 [Streptomyces sp. ADI92-24]
MTPHNELRLLPWPGPEGKPCFLSTDDNNGHLSRLADNIEATQLGMATELLEGAAEVLGHEDAEPDELRYLATALAEALHEVLRVATSRGHRLPIPDLTARGGGNEGPRLQAAAFG